MAINPFKALIVFVLIFTVVPRTVSHAGHLQRDKRSICPYDEWSPWINNDSPSTGDGDYEKMDTITRTSFCHLGSLQSVRCFEVNFNPVNSAKFTCDSVNGLACLNAVYGPTGCPDMKIQYRCIIPCPPPVPSLVVTTTKTSPTMSTPSTKFPTSYVTPMTTSAITASSPLTSLLLSTPTTTADRRTTVLGTFSFARMLTMTGLSFRSTSTMTVRNSATSSVSSATVRNARTMGPSNLPTSAVILVTGTSSIATSSTVSASTRNVPLSISTMGYTDLFISLNSTSFKSTLVTRQSDVEPAKAVGNVQKEPQAAEIWPIHAAVCGALFLIMFLLVIKICIMTKKKTKLEVDTEDPTRIRARKGSIQQVHPQLQF